MEKIPFTSYDFWAYLSAGFLLLFAADQALGTALLARDSWTVVQAVVAVTCAYAMGHLIASMSSLLFERLSGIDVLVAAHHGRENGKCEAMFDVHGCKPSLVVISDCAKKHQSQETVPYYYDKARGMADFRGQGPRYVLTTRNDDSRSCVTPGMPNPQASQMTNLKFKSWTPMNASKPASALALRPDCIN